MASGKGCYRCVRDRLRVIGQEPLAASIRLRVVETCSADESGHTRLDLSGVAPAPVAEVLDPIREHLFTRRPPLDCGGVVVVETRIFHARQGNVDGPQDLDGLPFGIAPSIYGGAIVAVDKVSYA